MSDPQPVGVQPDSHQTPILQPAAVTNGLVAIGDKADPAAPAVTPTNVAGEGAFHVAPQLLGVEVKEKPVDVTAAAIPVIKLKNQINLSDLSSVPSSLHSLNPTPIVADGNNDKPKLTPFSPSDYLLWFSDSFSYDKPKYFMMMTDCFRNVRLEDVGLAEAYDVPAIAAAGSSDVDQKEEAKEVDAREMATGMEKQTEPLTRDQQAQLLLTKFCLALDAFHDANEDYYDRLDVAHLAWDQKDYETSVKPKIFAGLAAKREMMEFWCEIEGKEMPPEQELAEQYKGPLWRGYDD